MYNPSILQRFPILHRNILQISKNKKKKKKQNPKQQKTSTPSPPTQTLQK